MLRESGHVIAVTGGAVQVRGKAPSSCARCAAGRGCGGAFFGRILGDTAQTITGQPVGELAAGDEVCIAIPESTLLHAAILAYLVPLAALLAGAVAGHLLAGETGAVAGSIGGLLPAMLYARQRVRASRRTLRPSVYRQ
ncbi:MAG: SoxR reducing system RseC family protein [Gammaproteobacteria bacterium]|nr:SoxR reducing system RseC family protein [Gammaproteobacteria bacterium]NNF59795.1 Fis family transcriptional regulator [Gammaproteobacteria bacterium]NNM20989.1 Fis family transcriptional regulator [Gammaproteobacteria bacterium]